MAAGRRARSSCRLARWLTPRRRRASCPASRPGSGMGGERLSRAKASLLLRRRCRGRGIGRVRLSFGGVPSRRRGRRRMQRRQMHVVAARRQRRWRNRLIGIGRAAATAAGAGSWPPRCSHFWTFLAPPVKPPRIPPDWLAGAGAAATVVGAACAAGASTGAGAPRSRPASCPRPPRRPSPPRTPASPDR